MQEALTLMLKMFRLNRTLSNLIKVLSTVLITSALGLELWNLSVGGIHSLLISQLDIVFYIGRFALISHGIESVIAALYAPSQNQSPLKYSIYTFFVGTVGLMELFQNPELEH